MWLLEWSPKRHVIKRDWTKCSKYVNHFGLKNDHNSERGGGGLYDHLMSSEFFTFTMNTTFV